MDNNDLSICLSRHDAYLSRVSEILSYTRSGEAIPRHLQFDQTEIKSLDESLTALASRLLQTPTPWESGWSAPASFAYCSDFHKHGPNGWLEAFYRGLRQSKSFFEGMQKAKSESNMTTYNITIKDVVGPVNVLSRLEHVVQAVSNSPSLSPQARDSLTVLFKELKDCLESSPAKQSEGAELVSEQAEEMAKELQRPAPRKEALKLKASGLIEAAKALKAVIPTAVEIAQKIADFVTNPLG